MSSATLPDDVFVLLFSTIPPFHLVSFRLVCLRWKQLIDKNAQIWRNNRWISPNNNEEGMRPILSLEEWSMLRYIACSMFLNSRAVGELKLSPKKTSRWESQGSFQL